MDDRADGVPREPVKHSNHKLRRTRLAHTAAGRASTPYYLVTIGSAISWGSAREYLSRFRIGANEWRLMAHVANDPGCTAAEVGQFLRIDKAVISRSLKSLVDKNFVGLDTHDGKRRIYLTEEGVARHDSILPVARRREQILLKGLNEGEREVLIGMLRRMHANLSAMNEFDHGADEQVLAISEASRSRV